MREFDWDGYRLRYGNIQRLDLILEAENDTTNRYKLSKQADVLMLFYVFSAEELTELLERLGYRLDPQAIPRNIAVLRRPLFAWIYAVPRCPRLGDGPVGSATLTAVLR